MTLAFDETALASQAAFRALMNALARPGEIGPVVGMTAPAPLAPAAAAIIVTLADYETPVWIDAYLAATPAIADWIRFQTGAYGNPFFPIVEIQFTVGDGAQHYHVPLLLSPYGYSTYRGS